TNIKTKAVLKKGHIDLEIRTDFFDAADRLISSINDAVPVSTKPLITYPLLTPTTADKIKFKVHVVDENHPSFEYFTFNVSKFHSANREFLQIVTATITRFDDGIILLNYTKPTETDMSDQTRNPITVTILTRGLVVFSTNVNKRPDGTSFVYLPKALYRELSPTFRVVAYYYVRRGSPELVADSLLVDVDDICLEEVFLYRQGFSFASPVPLKPKEKFGFNIVGTAGMKVGLVAVDKAVLLLNDRQTLTRQLLFHQLGSHDPGINVGDGSNSELILWNSGLKHMMIDTDDYSTSVTPRRVLNSLFFHDISYGRWPPLFQPQGPEGPRGLPGPWGLAGPLKQHSVDDSIKPPQPQSDESAPPPTPSHMRIYFPESWLFEEKTLPSNGRMSLHLLLPDSITTWSFLAVGLSANRGICVSEPLEQEVQKPFFVDIRMPFRASRLEEINVKVVVHNYQTNDLRAEVVFVGDQGICVVENSAKEADQNSISFHLEVAKGRIAERTVKIIPLKIGELALRVSVISHFGADAVEKKLYIVAEGIRVYKAITFVLDPDAKHATYKNERNGKITLTNTATITNEFYLSKNIQHTTIDLALPKEIIKGTESCRISAFGDLMGDIITHAVVQSKGLMEKPTLIAQEVLNDLGPIVHALNYISKANLMTDDLKERSQHFTRHGVTRLLTYKTGKAFSVRPTAKPATWLTSLILKSLCHAMSLAFIDKHNLIDSGFSWLQSQIKHDGSLNEQDWAGRKNNQQHRIELAAEALISVLECKRNSKEDHLTLQDKMANYLNKNLKKIKLPVVMAKTAYALLLYNPDAPQTKEAVNKLSSLAVNDSQGHIYWGTRQRPKQESSVHWYQDKVPESWIEATAYALLVFLHKDFRKNNSLNVDAVADWLVAQRKHNGAFNGAKDSTAAIQALTQYSLMKHKEEEIKVNMNLTVRTDRGDKNKYIFKFTQKNATQPESRNNVRVGEILEVLTEGQGLGQMQINVEYNIPVDKNQHCTFNASVEVQIAKVPPDSDNHLCSSCGFQCPKKSNTPDSSARVTYNRTLSILIGHIPQKKDQSKPKTNKNTKTKSSTKARNIKTKVKRSLPTYAVRSAKSYCITVCIRHVKGVSGPVDVKLEMFTGFRPVAEDVKKIQTLPDVLDARIVQTESATDILQIQFSKISDKKDSCFALRTTEEVEVERLNPAKLHITDKAKSTPSCVLEYHPLLDKESLKVYCADFHHINRGECKCFSGLCSNCRPVTRDDVDLDTTKKLACKADVVYQLQLGPHEDKIHWLEINATVHSVNKTKGSHDLKEGDEIVMMSPSSCHCFKDHFGKEEKFYLLSSDVDRLINREGAIVHRYVLDENTTFLRVSQPLGSNKSSNKEETSDIIISRPKNSFRPDKSSHLSHSVPHEHLFLGLTPDNACEP
ncbi:hypothetical protein Btru_025637, partial [Bulinus truncatus]